MTFDDEYRIVPETCLTLSEHLTVQSEFPPGQGFRIGPEEVEKDILAHTRAGPFSSLEQARAEATMLLEENPSYSLMIVKGPTSVEHLWNQDYWFKKNAEDEKKRSSRLFVTGLMLSAAILLWLTSPAWALGTLVVSLALSLLSWSPQVATQVIAPSVIAIVSAVLYSLLQ